MDVRRVMGVLVPLVLLPTWAGCGEGDTSPGFGTPTPEPTPWPIPPTPTPWPDAPTPTPPAVETLSLADAPGVFDGETLGDYAGYSVALVGDVNGDGFDDLAIGAPLSDALQPDGGIVYLVFGSLFGPESGSLGDSAASLVGEGRGDRAGQAVAGAGDVNGDGIDDLLIGAPFNDLGGQDAGRVYVVLGRTSGWYPEMRLTYAEYSFYGEPGDMLGDTGTLAGGGDIDGDGIDDIVLGVPHNGASFRDAGKVSIVTGKTSGWEKKARLASVSFQLLGSHADDWTGFSVAVVPDVNGDGMDEVLIGAPHESTAGDYAGRVYLFLGRASLPIISTDVTGLANLSWVGATAGEQAGVDVAAAGDLTGDGHEDFVFGGWGSAPSRGNGRFYVIDGDISFPEDPADAREVNLRAAMAVIQGYSDPIGRPGIGVGDVNGDGYGELLLGDPLMGGETAAEAGAAFLYLGRDARDWMTLEPTGEMDYFFVGESLNSYAGYAIAGRGDINDDGYMDFAIGAFGTSVGVRDGAGRVYLYYGGEGAW